MDKEFLTLAAEEAIQSVTNNLGGPFGAVIVQNGQVIGKGTNRVTSTNDPTAHAEIVAIREACRNTKSFHLSGAVLYTSCEPCPMCLAAIYWAGIQTVYYGADKEDAKNMGFDDKFIYEQLVLPIEEREVSMVRLEVPMVKELQKIWEEKEDKIPY
ncbi:MAG: nucleoside deaminase [Bacteroidales bacterium]|nr:nucleoside deaminase [Bacteroidales bacterium]